MEPRNALARKSITLAFAASLLLHAAILFFRILLPEAFSPAPADSAKSPHTRLDVSIARPESTQIVEPPSRQIIEPPSRQIEVPALEPKKKQTVKPVHRKTPKIITDVWTKKSWTRAERADMDKFLNELAEQAKPSSGRELSEKALLDVKKMAKNRQEVGGGETAVDEVVKGSRVEPFSMTMYFDSFVRKLNRSAAFVKNEPRSKGRGKALVQITLNQDGSLKSFRILRADDQQAEIAYIKSVIDRASPFSAFPPDIRNAMDSLSILMCILPAQAGGTGFSRSLSGQDC